MKAKILIVDDDKHIRLVMEEMFRRKQYSVNTAVSFEEALQLLAETAYDLVISDIFMSFHSGIELLKEMTKQQMKIPVVLMTGCPSVDTATEAVRLGAFDYIMKPVDFRELMSLVEKALRHKALQDERDRLEQENELYRQRLETLVEVRTIRLKRVIAKLRAEISKRKKVETELTRANLRLSTEIEERKQAEAARAISEERLNYAMEASTDGIYDYNLHTNRFYYSVRWYTMLGYAPHELSPSFSAWVSLIHEEDRDKTLQSIRSILKETDSFEMEFRMRKKNGQWLWVLSRGKVFARDESGSPYRIVGTNFDMTERKAANERIQQAYSELHQVFNSTSDGICLAGYDNQIIRINQAMSNLLQWDINQVRGRKFFDILPPFDYQLNEKPTFQNGNRTGQIEYDLTVNMPNNERLYLTLTVTRFKRTDTEFIGYLYNIRDITRRILAEEQARIKDKQLLLADKMTSLGILVSGVAHEINNPNNFIMMNAPLLKQAWQEVLPILNHYEQQQPDFQLVNIPYQEMKTALPELVEGVMEGARRIQAIVRSLKDYIRNDPANIMEILDINQLVKKSLILLNNLIKQTTTAFAVRYGEMLPSVYGNADRIGQVIVNLVENACQALTDMRQGINIDTFADVAQAQVVLRIRDEGGGIAPEHIPRLMDPFFTTKRDLGGTGLGLSVCDSIVKEHQGVLAFDSVLGQGTTVWLKLPVLMAGKPDASAAASGG